MATIRYGGLGRECVRKWKVGVVGGIVSLVFALVAVSPATAVEFSLLNGEVTGSLDTTLSYSAGVRTGEPVDKADLDNITMRDWTFDQGDLYSNSFKVSPELELKWKNYGFVGRVTGYWDTVIDRGSSSRSDYPFDQGDGNGWSDDAEDEIGRGFSVADLYVYGSYDIENFMGLGYAPVDLRLGNQVFNWGEGSYYFDGLNSTNAVDLTKLVQPGSEFKDATIAVPAVLVQVGLFDNLSVDTYYQFGWSESKYPPVGTFFADDSDIFGQGGKEVMKDLGFGPMSVASRLGDLDARDDGQFGISTRYGIGDFELGAYYTRSHSQLPQLQYIVPDTADPFQYLADNAFRFIYPEDVDMYGLSLATSMSGWAIAAEVAYRPNAVIMSINPNEYLNTQIGNLFFGTGPQGSFDAGRLGTVNPGDVIDAYEQRDAWHGQVNALKVFGPGLSFDTTWLFLTAAADHLPGDREGLASWGPEGQDPDAVAWGYSVDVDSTWYNVLPSLSITPGVSWFHAVNGYSHANGNFWEGNKSIQLRVNTDYGDRWSFNLNYNRTINDENAYAENGSNANFTASYKF